MKTQYHLECSMDLAGGTAFRTYYYTGSGTWSTNGDDVLLLDTMKEAEQMRDASIFSQGIEIVESKAYVS